jgi:hypothetical protein
MWKSALTGRRTKQMVIARIDATQPLSAWNSALIHSREIKQIDNLTPEERDELLRSVEARIAIHLPAVLHQKKLITGLHAHQSDSSDSSSNTPDTSRSTQRLASPSSGVQEATK